MNVVEMRRVSTEQVIEKIDDDIQRLEKEIAEIAGEKNISKNPVRTEAQSNMIASKMIEKNAKENEKAKLLFLDSSKKKLNEIQPEIDIAIGTDSIKTYKLALETIFKLTNELRNDAMRHDAKELITRINAIEDYVKTNGKVAQSA